MAKKDKKTDDHGWDVGGRRREEDPDIQFLRLKARKARPAKALLWAILVALLIVILARENSKTGRGGQPQSWHSCSPSVLHFRPS